jgi:hypothetical protein
VNVRSAGDPSMSSMNSVIIFCTMLGVLSSKHYVWGYRATGRPYSAVPLFYHNAHTRC